MSTSIQTRIYQWLNFVQFSLLPATCVICSGPGQTNLDLCPRCEQALPTTHSCCAGCALPLPAAAEGLLCGRCLQQPRRIHTTVAACHYEGEVRELITGFKYRRQLAGGRVLAGLLRQTVQQRYRAEALPELLLPVPLHPARLRERGYNQALLIGRDVATPLGLGCLPRALLRTRVTPTQQGLSAKERRRNLRGAFTLALPAQLAQVQHIALVDDVVTTMSTVNEIARVLQRALQPPPRIDVWCLARA